MTYRRAILLAGVFCLLTSGAAELYAQNISMRFDHLTIQDGLSQSTINDMLQDEKGFLWFATDDGLNRYNGYEFTVYKNVPDDSTSLSDNSISKIIEDRDGNIWVATRDGGLNKFDRTTEQFTRYTSDPENTESLSDNYVTALFEDRSGVILVGTQEGLNIYQPEQDNFLHYKTDPDDTNSLQGNWITSIFEDHNGIIWIGTQSNGLNRFDRETNTFTQYKNDPGTSTSLSSDWVISIYEDRYDILWVGTQDGGLNSFDRKSETFRMYRHNPENPRSLNHDWVLTMFEDSYGDLWVGTVSGLSLFDREDDKFIDVSAINDAPDLANKSITALLGDRSGVFWVGTRDNALYKFVRSTASFKIYDSNMGNLLSLSDENVWAVEEDNTGSLWVGTNGGGVNRYNADRTERQIFRHDPGDTNSLSDNFVNTIFEDSDGTIWIGTLNGLERYDSNTDTFTHYKYEPGKENTIPGNIITTISEDHLGKLWIGTLNNGLSQYDKDTGEFRNYASRSGDIESLSHNKIWSFYEDQDGVFWVGTHGYGLNKYDRKNDVFQRYVNIPGDTSSISNNFINFIYQDASQRYWIGTLNGLNKFIPETETFQSYTVDDGLPNSVIYGIIEDDRGHLWLSTNKGISDFDPENEVFRNYDQEDGLPSDEFRFGAYHRADDGTMYFGSINGLVAFEPDSIRDNPHIPSVVFTRLEVSNQPISIGDDSILKESITEVDTLHFSYNDNVISFQFAALHYAAPVQNQYAYKLENFDEDWQYIGNRRFISFTSLPAGDYTLRVRAANKDEIWNEEGASLYITIPPPPWFTWWAFMIYGAVLLAAIVGYIQYRIGKEKQKKRQLQVQNQMLEGLVSERTSELQNEKEKSDRLLYNILPREVAEELKEYGTTTPKRFEQATILFTDFKSFTTAASNMPADELVSELNDIFRKFDEIIDRYGLEKIKTIGDGYMAAGGLPLESENHALQCVKAAREMLSYIEKRNKFSRQKWRMRVGLHTGDVIAGVVGQRKFTYDLWGETVIIASRMEAAGEEGKVNISSATHKLVKEFYDCEYRGKIIAEGKGKVDMYFVNYEQSEVLTQE